MAAAIRVQPICRECMFKEDSPKFWSLIPFVGVIYSSVAGIETEARLTWIIENELRAPQPNNIRVIRLIELKNGHLMSHLIRNSLTSIAFSIATMIASILASGAFVFSTFAFGHTFACISLEKANNSFKDLLYNGTVIKELRETGIRPGMYIR